MNQFWIVLETKQEYCLDASNSIRYPKSLTLSQYIDSGIITALWVWVFSFESLERIQWFTEPTCFFSSLLHLVACIEFLVITLWSNIKLIGIPGSNLCQAVEKDPLFFIKLKLIMKILNKAYCNTSMWCSGKYCYPVNGGILVGPYNNLETSLKPTTTVEQQTTSAFSTCSDFSCPLSYTIWTIQKCFSLNIEPTTVFTYSSLAFQIRQKFISFFKCIYFSSLKSYLFTYRHCCVVSRVNESK